MNWANCGTANDISSLVIIKYNSFPNNLSYNSSSWNKTSSSLIWNWTSLAWDVSLTLYSRGVFVDLAYANLDSSINSTTYFFWFITNTSEKWTTSKSLILNYHCKIFFKSRINCIYELVSRISSTYTLIISLCFPHEL